MSVFENEQRQKRMPSSDLVGLRLQDVPGLLLVRRGVESATLLERQRVADAVESHAVSGSRDFEEAVLDGVVRRSTRAGNGEL